MRETFPVNWKYVSELEKFVFKLTKWQEPFLVVDEGYVYFVTPWAIVRFKRQQWMLEGVEVMSFRVVKVLRVGKRGSEVELEPIFEEDNYIRTVQGFFVDARQRENSKVLEIEKSGLRTSSSDWDKFEWISDVSRVNYRLVKEFDLLVNFGLLERFLKVLLDVADKIGENQFEVKWDGNVFHSIWFCSKDARVEGLLMGLRE